MNEILYIEQCSSTNDEIFRVLPYSFPEIFGIYTLHQTQGRGQYGNSWTNTEGKNLAFSMALQSRLFSSDNFINFCTAVFVRDFLANLADAEVKIKWPNDIILNGKKVCGILLEKKKIENKMYYIIGIGLNILQENFDGLNRAGSLYTQTEKKFDPKDLAEKLFGFLRKEFLKNPDFNEILNQFNENLFRKNEISVFEKNGFRQNGIIKNMDESGFLWIELENDGLQKFFHKEIAMLY